MIISDRQSGRDRHSLSATLPAKSTRRRWGRSTIRKLKGFILPLLILVIWQLVQSQEVYPTNLLPTPSTVVETVLQLANSGELWDHIGATVFRVLQGFLLGTISATLLGFLTGISRNIREFLDPSVQAIRNIPSLAWVPLFILWLGIYEESKVALIAVGAFFPIYLSLLQGLLAVDRKLVEVGRMYRLNRWQLITRVLFPAALPEYITGLRGGLGLAWMFVVAAEVMGASKGLGFLLVDGQTTGRAALIIGSIFLFALLGKLSDSFLAALTSPLLKWQDTHAQVGS